MNILESIRNILGEADFYIENGSYSGTWDYGALIEYLICGLILCICVSSIFKFLRSLVK